MWTELNNLTVQNISSYETENGKRYLRISAREPFNEKGMTPSYTIMVYDNVEKVLEDVNESVVMNCVCKVRTFLNRQKEVQDLSFLMIDYELVETTKITYMDKYITLPYVKITSLEKTEKLVKGKMESQICMHGFGSKSATITPQYAINVFNREVVEKLIRYKVGNSSCINCKCILSPYMKKRGDNSFQDYSYKLIDFEFAENRERKKEEKNTVVYNATAPQWNLDELDIFTSEFTEKL